MVTGARNAKYADTKAYNAFNLADFVVGAEVANVINVGVTLKDARNRAVGAPVVCRAYLSDNADGSTVTATVPTSTVAIGTDGKILSVDTTDKALTLISKSNGKFDLNITQTAAPVTYYLVLVMPDGSLVISPAITYA